MSTPGTSGGGGGGATVGTLNVEVALQLARLNADFEKLKGTVRTHTRGTNQQFQQMAHESGQAMHGLRDQISHTFDHLQRRAFNATKFVHGIFAGFGVGSGAALVEGVFHKFHEMWHEAAEKAKELEERAEHMQEKFSELAKTRFQDFVSGLLPERKVKELDRHIAHIKEQLKGVEDSRQRALGDVASLANRSRGPVHGLEFEGRYGNGLLTQKGVGDKALEAANKAQDKFIELDRELSEAQKQRAEARKRILEEEAKRLEKIGEIQEHIAAAERERSEVLSDKTPRQKMEALEARVARLKYELSIATRFAQEDATKDPKARAGDLQAQLERTKQLTEAERELGQAKKEVVRAAEEDARKLVEKARERERLQAELQNAVERERDKIMGRSKANQGAGMLGQHAQGDPLYRLGTDQLHVLRNILAAIERRAATTATAGTPGYGF